MVSMVPVVYDLRFPPIKKLLQMFSNKLCLVNDDDVISQTWDSLHLFDYICHGNGSHGSYSLHVGKVT